MTKKTSTLFVLATIVCGSSVHSSDEPQPFSDFLNSVYNWSNQSVGYSKYRWERSRNELLTMIGSSIVVIETLSISAPEIEITNKSARYYIEVTHSDLQKWQVDPRWGTTGRSINSYLICEFGSIQLELVDPSKGIALELVGAQKIRAVGAIKQFNIDEACVTTLTFEVETWEIVEPPSIDNVSEGKEKGSLVRSKTESISPPAVAESEPHKFHEELGSSADSIIRSIQFSLVSINPGVSGQQQELVSSLGRGDFIGSVAVAEEIIKRLDDTRSSPVTRAHARTNLGLIHWMLNGTDEGLRSSLAQCEQDLGFHHPGCLYSMQHSAYSASVLKNYLDSEVALRKFQHTLHKMGGLMTLTQLEVIHSLTKLYLKQGKLFDADREQEFRLGVSEQAYGENGEELIPTLQQLGAYFASRGSMFSLSSPRYYRDWMFRQSFGYYERTIKIIEDKYGANHLRLIEPLRTVAYTRLLQYTQRTKAEVALERVLQIINHDPASSVQDRVKAMVSLSDMYVITGDPRGEQIYLDSWQLLQEDPTNQQLSIEIFGTPTRLYPEIDGILYLDRTPDAALGEDVELFIDVSYTVLANGRVSNIEVIDKNVPNAQVRYMNHHLKRARFRPRILDGKLVASKNLLIHQTFEIIPWNKITTNTPPSKSPK